MKRRSLTFTRSQQRVVAISFGIAFILLLLGLALLVPYPTDFQYAVFRIVLALAAAGVAATIPGFLSVEVTGAVRAGGAIGVFVVVYFFSPANLVVQYAGESSNHEDSLNPSPGGSLSRLPGASGGLREAGQPVVLQSFSLSTGRSAYEETYDGGRTGKRLRTFRPDPSSGLRRFEPVFNIAIENTATDRTILVTRVVYHIVEAIGELGGGDLLPDLLEPLATYVHGIRPLPGYYSEHGWVFTDAEYKDLDAAPLLIADLQPQITVPPASHVAFDLQVFAESEPVEVDYRMKLEIVTSVGSVETEEFVLVIAPHETHPPASWQRARIVPRSPPGAG